MTSTKRNKYITSLILVAAVTGGLWWGIPTWSKLRHRQYRELVTDFQRAQRRDKLPSNDSSIGWEFQVHLPDKQTTNLKPTIVNIQAASHPGVVRVHYSDESNERSLYEYVDYSSPAEIKTSGNVLYIHWVETLFSTNHWLLAYDLADRRELAKHRINANDLEIR